MTASSAKSRFPGAVRDRALPSAASGWLNGTMSAVMSARTLDAVR